MASRGVYELVNIGYRKVVLLAGFVQIFVIDASHPFPIPFGTTTMFASHFGHFTLRMKSLLSSLVTSSSTDWACLGIPFLLFHWVVVWFHVQFVHHDIHQDAFHIYMRPSKTI